MREIKFRAFIDGEMIGPDDLAFDDFQPLSDLLSNCDNLMQFTGLQDKKGKDIYEGDIYIAGDAKIKYVVIFRGCGFIGAQVGNKSLAGLEHFIKDTEVIGNIHQNPELLTNKGDQ